MRGRLALAGCSLLALLGACSPEPDFDERYAEASRRIEERAGALDRELASETASPAPSEGSRR